MTERMSARTVERLWVRVSKALPPEPHPVLELIADGGTEGDHTFGKKRHVTLIFADDWARTIADLGQDVDPSARRANVLLSGGDAPSLVGQRVRLGAAEIEIHGIVHPCDLMDEMADGLQEAMRPEGRGGVWGRVLTSGAVCVGDTLEVLD